METRQTLTNLIPALIKAKQSFSPLIKDVKNTFLSDKNNRTVMYADLASAIEATEKPLLDNGLVLIQIPVSDATGIGVVSVLFHTSGEFIQSDPFFLPLGTLNAQTGVAAITYARRASLLAILNIAAQDDDGTEASNQIQKHSPAPKTERVAPSEPPAGKESAPTPQGSDSSALPTEAQYSSFIERGRALITLLKDPGGMVASEGMTIGKKMNSFFMKSASTDSLKKITMSQWNIIFGIIEAKQKQPDGIKAVVQMIEKDIK